MPNLGRLERVEKQPSLDVVFRLAAALGVAPGDLVKRIDAQVRRNLRRKK